MHVHGVNVGAAVHQQVGNAPVAAPRDHVKQERAVNVGCVRIESVVQEPHTVTVATALERLLVGDRGFRGGRTATPQSTSAKRRHPGSVGRKWRPPNIERRSARVAGAHHASTAAAQAGWKGRRLIGLLAGSRRIAVAIATAILLELFQHVAQRLGVEPQRPRPPFLLNTPTHALLRISCRGCRRTSAPVAPVAPAPHMRWTVVDQSTTSKAARGRRRAKSRRGRQHTALTSGASAALRDRRLGATTKGGRLGSDRRAERPVSCRRCRLRSATKRGRLRICRRWRSARRFRVRWRR